MDLATRIADQTIRCARVALLGLALAAAIAASQAPASAHSLRQVSPDADATVDHGIGRPTFSLSQIDLIDGHDLIDRLPNVVRLPRDLGFRLDNGLETVDEIRSDLVGSCLELCGAGLSALQPVA